MNDKSSPGRDFIGYADQPPTVVWPDEARVATISRDIGQNIIQTRRCTRLLPPKT